jgi:hypothetical protein
MLFDEKKQPVTRIFLGIIGEDELLLYRAAG